MPDREGRPRQRHSHGSPPRRRSPPPEATGQEKEYWAGLVESGEPLTAHLDDGSSVNGPVVAFDQDTLQLQASDHRVLLRKAQIRYLEGP